MIISFTFHFKLPSEAPQAAKRAESQKAKHTGAGKAQLIFARSEGRIFLIKLGQLRCSVVMKGEATARYASMVLSPNYLSTTVVGALI